MIAETSKDLMARLFEGINVGDFAPLEGHPGFHETRQHVPPMHNVFADWRTAHLQQIAEGDLVCTYCALELTHRGTFAAVAPTGRRVSLEVLSLDQVRDGVVVEHNSTSTWPDVLRQLGAPAFASWPSRRPRTLAQQHRSQPAATLRANKAAVIEMLAALSRGAFAAYASDNLGDLVDRFVELLRAFPDLALTPVVQIAEGDLVATRATLRGAHLGVLYGTAGSGKAISWDIFCLARVADGAVVEQQSLIDWNAALAQLGLLAM
jgi:predicted ester cyclase